MSAFRGRIIRWQDTILLLLLRAIYNKITYNKTSICVRFLLSFVIMYIFMWLIPCRVNLIVKHEKPMMKFFVLLVQNVHLSHIKKFGVQLQWNLRIWTIVVEDFFI